MGSTGNMRPAGRFSARKLGKRLAYVLLAAIILYGVKKKFLSSPHVVVAKVRREDFTAEVQGTGTIAVDQEAEISAKIPGRIAKVLVDQGDFVHRGQLIAVLENTDLDREVARARARLSAAQASVEAAQSIVQARRATAWQTRRDWKREEHLVATGAVSQEEADFYREQYLTAMNGVGAASAEVEAAQRGVGAATADLQLQEFDLSETRLFTYLPGVVVNLPKQPGDAIVPGESVVTVADPRVTMVDASVDQRFSGEIRAGQRATVIVRGRPDHPFQGQVFHISPQADPGTEEMTVEVQFALPPKELELGQWADVYIDVGAKKDAIVIPSAAVMEMTGKRFVFAVGRNHRLHRTAVKLVANNPRSPLVAIKGNLKVGDLVVLKPMGLKPRQKVIVRLAHPAENQLR